MKVNDMFSQGKPNPTALGLSGVVDVRTAGGICAPPKHSNEGLISAVWGGRVPVLLLLLTCGSELFERALFLWLGMA